MEKDKKKKVIAGAVGGIAIVAVGLGIGNNAEKEKIKARCSELLTNQTKVLSDLETDAKKIDTLLDELQKTDGLKDTSDAASILASSTTGKSDTIKPVTRCSSEKDQKTIEQQIQLIGKKSDEAREKQNKISSLIEDFGKNKKELDEAMSLLNQLKGEAQSAYDSTQGAVQDENVRAALKKEIEELDSFLSSSTTFASLSDAQTFKGKAQAKVKSMRTAAENVKSSVEKKKEADAEEARVAAEKEAALKAEQEAARKARQESTHKAPAQRQPAQPAPPASSGGQQGAGDSSGSVYYKNCAEARAAGAAPIYKGQPGYRPGLDGDHDGVACEPKKKGKK